MNLDDIMINKMSQQQKDNVKFHLYEVLGIVKFIETQSRMVAARGSGERRLGS